MGIIVANLFVTLDGVYQAPGGPDEDTSGGFRFGGWQAPILDDEAGEQIGSEIDRLDALLLGRRTYDIFAGYWPKASGPIAEKFAAVPKYVVSRTLTQPEWQGTTALPDAASAGRLREEYDEVHVIGSGGLIRSLFEADAIDRLRLYLHPIALGEGKRMFEPGAIPTAFRLIEPARTFPSGVVSLTYERAGDVETGDMSEFDGVQD